MSDNFQAVQVSFFGNYVWKQIATVCSYCVFIYLCGWTYLKHGFSTRAPPTFFVRCADVYCNVVLSCVANNSYLNQETAFVNVVGIWHLLCFAIESPDYSSRRLSTGMSCDRFKLAILRFHVRNSNEELTTALHVYARLGACYVTRRRG
jgi:hypothetical protein